MNGWASWLTWEHPLTGWILLVVGCCLGSFFNVCIYRIPLGISVVVPRSRCAACGIALKGWENVPVLGWLWLRGRCACQLTRIDWRYPVIEMLTGLMFWGLWKACPASLFLPYALFLGGLLIASTIDIDHFIIPDRFTLGGIVAGLIACGIWPMLQEQRSLWGGLMESLRGAFVGGAILWSVAWLGKKAFKKEAMGLGDVKLLAAMGAFLGWKACLFIVATSSLIGSLAGVAVLLSGRQSWGSRLPYGPFLSLAAALWVFGGKGWVEAYFSYLQRVGSPS